MASDVPAGLQARGVRLWRMFLAQDASMANVDDPRREVALEACRVADRLERLNEICDRVDPIIETDKGALTHPAFPEARQQANVLKQLVAALRLPDEATGKRPQRRGPRGAQRPSVVSSLDRARARSAGA